MPYNWTTPIVDRTDEDVERLKQYDLIGYKNLTESQKMEWYNDMDGMKGALDKSDLNRIESNIGYLAEQTLISLPIMSRWAYEDIFDLSNANRVLTNIQKLVSRFSFRVQPQIPGAPLNSYQKINQIESLLLRMYEALNRVQIEPNFLTSDEKEIQFSDDKILSCWIPPVVD